jgi:hypothetical protein
VEFTTQVRDLKVIAGELYILGTHYTWNGASMQGPYQLARYDGQTFCSFGGMDILAHDIAGLNGRLYVTTSYYNHPDQYKGIAEWMGGNTVDICVSQPLQLDDDHESLPVPKVFPNPTEGFFKLHGLSQASRCNFSVYDITGREMMPEQKYTGGEVDVSMLPVGVYVVEIRMRDRVQRMKLVKQ